MYNAVPDPKQVTKLMKRIRHARKIDAMDETLTHDINTLYNSFITHTVHSQSLSTLTAVSAALGQPDTSWSARIKRRLVGPISMNALYPDWDRQDKDLDVSMRLDIFESRCEFVWRTMSFIHSFPMIKVMNPDPIERDADGSIVVICPSYPTAQNPYAGNFIHQRVLAYQSAGQSVKVLVPTASTVATGTDKSLGVEVTRLAEADLAAAVRDSPVRAIALHSPPLSVLSRLDGLVPPEMMSVFLHGYETRDYARLLYNFPKGHMKANAKVLEPIHFSRMVAARKLFQDPRVNVIFVSEFLRTIAETDVGIKATNAHIIPNYINGDKFKYREKTQDDRFSVLAIRPFVRANYGGDLIIKTLQGLSRHKEFANISFTLRGYGDDFDKAIVPLKDFRNIDVAKGILTQNEIVMLHQKNGVFLCPSRHDTQGVSLCEAMSSGLVPVTNAIGGIPEFVSADTGLLARDHNPQTYANLINALIDDPARFQRLSQSTATSMQTFCGRAATIDRELALFSGNP